MMGGFQIRDFYFKGDAGHHPLLITVLYTSFYSIGRDIIGNINIGMCMFSIFQMSFMSVIFAYTVKYIEKITENKTIRNISIIFYALFPYNQLFSIITTKDVIFAGLFLLFIVNLYKNVKEDNKIVDYIFLIIIGIVTLLSRNNSVFTLEVALPFIIIALIRKKKMMVKIVATFLIIIISYKLINAGLYSLISKQNDEGSMRTFIFAQFAGKLAKENADDLTEEEKEKISYYFKDYTKLAQEYKPAISDNTVSMVAFDNLKNDKNTFLDFMFSLIQKYPRVFMDSFLNNVRGFWYIPDNSFNSYNHDKYRNIMGALELWDLRIVNQQNSVKPDSKFPVLNKFDRKMFCENEYQNIPVLYIIFQPATYFYISFAYLLYSIYKNKKDRLIISIVIFTFFASCFVAPAAIIRYMYPVIVCIPLMLGTIFEKHRLRN